MALISKPIYNSLIFSCLILFFSIKTNAQNFDTVRKLDNITTKAAEKSETYTPLTTVPVKIHIIRKSNGTEGIDPNIISSLISNLNDKFSATGLQFNAVGAVHFIDSDRYYNLNYFFHLDELVSFNNVDDAINIYFTSFINTGNSVDGQTNSPSGSRTRNNIVINNYVAINRNGLAYYMGEYFGLLPTASYTPNQELVNGTNCLTTGDLLCDTPADPGCCYNANTCQYTGTELDKNGQQFNPLVNNIMSNYYLCRSNFTNGQNNKIIAGYNQRLSLSLSSKEYNYNTETVVNAPSNLTFTPSGCNLTLRWSDNANNEMGYIIESSLNVNGPFISIGRVSKDVTSFFDSRSLTNNITWYYRVIASNSNALHSETISYTSSSSTLCYCKVIPADCNNSYIKKVKIWEGDNEIVNKVILEQNSFCSSNGYSYYNSNPPTLEISKVYRISIELYNSIVTSNARCWIDFNRDAIFSDNEVVFNFFQFSPNTITIPQTASEGNLRMRVRSREYLSPTNACGEYNVGETEDYEIIIRKPCSMPLVASGIMNTNLITNEYIATSGTNTVSPNNIIIYSAKKYVMLNPGFVASPNTGYYFSVNNNGCQ